jgi:beta-phosphoglucomutase-like phosphatase (HAD superfamily)
VNRLELGLKIEGVIFDNDGTLVDSGSLSAEVIVGIVTDHGALVSFEEALDRYRGTKLVDFARGPCSEISR